MSGLKRIFMREEKESYSVSFAAVLSWNSDTKWGRQQDVSAINTFEENEKEAAK